MNQQNTPIKRALISVSDKHGIVDFAQSLAQMNIELISTGGTCKLLKESNIPVKEIAEITKFPEMMDGRVKTLHPKIHGGILGLRNEHASIAEQHQIPWIDLVVVNLYPFAATIAKPNTTFDDAIENIDIGGPTMLRSAAKNMGWVTVIVDPNDYTFITTQLQQQKSTDFNTRKQLATKAFAHTAQYDSMIHNYLEPNAFPLQKNITLEKTLSLRYGENPHQAAAAYRFPQNQQGILVAIQHQGKELSYNNIADADAACACVQEFSEPACVIVKHANPCGVALGDTIEQAFTKAHEADAQSAFGGIIALNRECTTILAEKITNTFFEVLIAPAYTKEALAIFAKKPNLRVLQCDFPKNISRHEYKHIQGGMLIQEKDTMILTANDLKIVTEKKPTAQELHSLLFAWQVVKHIKSNAILIANDNVTCGVGAGQVSRVDAVDIAIRKAGSKTQGAILASDAFFPFRDSIDLIAKAGITAIIQPGGSLRDPEIIAACNEHGLTMVFTGYRCFKH